MKPNTIYKFSIEYQIDYFKSIGLHNGDNVVCLGEITNMPDHYIVVTREGKVLWGLHPEYLGLS